jgi:hypothetical protein
MPAARNEGHSIQAGLQTVASFNSTHEVQNFAVQSDQRPIEWAIDSELSVPPRPARITANADLSRSSDGFFSATLGMTYITNGMLSYLLSTFFAGSAETSESTIKTFDEADTAIYLQGLLIRPNVEDGSLEYAGGGWRNVLLRFVRGTVIT